VQALDPNLPVADVRTMDQMVHESLAGDRFQALLFGGFAAVALLLAALGISGVTAFWVSQRTQEIGIRIALGAQGGDVVGMVMRQGVQLTLWGIVAGLAGALPLSGLLRGLLFGTSFFDPATFAAIAALLLATAMAACYLPARRATRVDPMRALRSE
jgi:putative ABC transport system permease protein